MPRLPRKAIVESELHPHGVMALEHLRNLIRVKEHPDLLEYGEAVIPSFQKPVAVRGLKTTRFGNFIMFRSLLQHYDFQGLLTDLRNSTTQQEAPTHTPNNWLGHLTEQHEQNLIVEINGKTYHVHTTGLIGVTHANQSIHMHITPLKQGQKPPAFFEHIMNRNIAEINIESTPNDRRGQTLSILIGNLRPGHRRHLEELIRFLFDKKFFENPPSQSTRTIRLVK